MDDQSRTSMIGTSIDNLRNLQMPEERVNRPTRQKESIEDFDIDELTKDINDNIQEDTFLPSSESEEDKSTYIPFGWKEPLLLLFIYLLLSQSLVRQFFGKYIPQLNPGADGTVGFLGVLIYGILLVTVYFISKKLLII